METSTTYFAFSTRAHPQTEGFLSKLTSKLGGKYLKIEDLCLCIFAKAPQACHGAAYFLHKALTANQSPLVVVFCQTKQNLFKKASDLLALDQPGYCLMTDDVTKELENLDCIFEPYPTDPSSGLTEQVFRLIEYKEIQLQQEQREDFFDYTQVESKNSEEASSSEDPGQINTPSTPMEEEPLEISEVNQIYDFHKEQALKEQQKQEQPEKQADPSIPDYAQEVKQALEKSDDISENESEQQEDQENIEPEQELDKQPSSDQKPNALNVWFSKIKQRYPKTVTFFENKRNLLLFCVGGFSFVLLLIFTLTGSAPTETEITQQEPEQTSIVETLTNRNSQAKSKFLTVETQDDQVLDLFPAEITHDTAYLRLRSKPDGALVTINGHRLKGETPFDTFLIQGNQPLDIVLEKQGYEKIQRRETIPPGSRRGFVFELIPDR